MTPSPLREDATPIGGTSPQLARPESMAERIPFVVTPCIVQSLEEKDEEVAEGSIVAVAINWEGQSDRETDKQDTLINNQPSKLFHTRSSYLPTLRQKQTERLSAGNDNDERATGDFKDISLTAQICEFAEM